MPYHQIVKEYDSFVIVEELPSNNSSPVPPAQQPEQLELPGIECSEFSTFNDALKMTQSCPADRNDNQYAYLTDREPGHKPLFADFENSKDKVELSSGSVLLEPGQSVIQNYEREEGELSDHSGSSKVSFDAVIPRTASRVNAKKEAAHNKHVAQAVDESNLRSTRIQQKQHSEENEHKSRFKTGRNYRKRSDRPGTSKSTNRGESRPKNQPDLSRQHCVPRVYLSDQERRKQDRRDRRKRLLSPDARLSKKAKIRRER
ncbi:hypothetical protein L596_010569 [Steinernema carpocapsae]|uniref:Uncharacterized protein n=1 Tax=Steinernema carpocapsae TaxID=34508 RepID=A0A4U5PIY1_STECR|nr:hypothetical protein L596_010569 [Steinernema carpocapsae]